MAMSMAPAGVKEMPFDPAKAWTVSTVVILGILMTMLDSTVTTVALPTIMNVFGVSLTGIQWVTTAYTLAMAVIVPLGPYLSRVFGAERVFHVALAVFTACSFMCGFAWSINTLILFRVLQAFGGGIMMPIGMGMVMALFPPSKRGLAMGVFGVAMTAAPAFGPTLGGYIVDSLGWEYVFYVNVPIGVIAVALAFFFFDFGKRKPFPRFDISGFISSALGSSFLLYLLGKSDNIDWSDHTYIYMLIVGIGAMIFFIVNEIVVDEPLLDLRILKHRNYTVSMILVVVQQLMMMGVVYTTPMFLQNFRGLTALQSGEVLLPSSLVMGILMPVAGKLTDIAGERGTKWLIASGVSLCGIMTFILSSKFTLDVNITDIIILNSIRNIGLGISMMPVMTLGLFSIPVDDAQKATALQRFIQQFSSSMVVAVITYSITTRFNANYAGATAQLTSSNLPLMDTINELAANMVAQGMAAADAASQALTTIVTQIYQANYVLAMQFTIFWTAIVGTCAILLVPFFKVDKKKQAELAIPKETTPVD